MSSPNTVILFDLGRVLMHIDFDAFPNALGLTTTEARLQFDQRLIQHNVRLYETGRMSTDEFIEALYNIFQQQFSREKLLDAFNRIIVEDNQEISPFIETVRKHHRIAVLSNTCACHWEKVMKISSIIKLFPDLFTSFSLGAMKPDMIVYDKVCTTLHVQPNDVLFIDDLKENVEGAVRAGMNGIIFSNTEQLKSDFNRLIWK